MIEELLQPLAPITERLEYSRPQDALLRDIDLPLHGIFHPLGYPVEIITNHPVVLAAAQESFGHAHLARLLTPLQVCVGVTDGGGPHCPPEPTRREYNHLYSLVADVHNQALLDLNTCASFTWLTQAAVENRLYLRYNFLEKVVYLLLGASVVTDLHSACVSKNGRGILLCGDSGAGKSTLAYACARAGWTYTSDDTSYLINDSAVARIIGHSHRARFRPSAKALFPELEGRALTPRMEGKPSIEVLTSELPIPSTATEATVNSIVYLKRNPSADGSLTLMPHGTATQRASRELYSSGDVRAKHERILEILAEIPTYEMQYCNLDQGIQTLESLTQIK